MQAPLFLPGSPMSVPVIALPTIAELIAFIHRTLCEQDALDPGQTPLIRTPLTRNRRPCGAVFHVEGPRLLRTSAVWSAEENRIIFYESTGLRGREVELSESPEAIDAAPLRAA